MSKNQSLATLAIVLIIFIRIRPKERIPRLQMIHPKRIIIVGIYNFKSACAVSAIRNTGVAQVIFVLVNILILFAKCINIKNKTIAEEDKDAYLS